MPNNKTPLWLHWIMAATSGSGVLYFVLSRKLRALRDAPRGPVFMHFPCI